MPEPRAKLAVVTGAGRGLGLETARVLAARGHSVILTARRKGDAAAAAASIAGAIGAALDVADDDAVNAFFDELFARHGRIDVLVNNAGRYFAESGGIDAGAAALGAAIDNNALSAWRTMRRALPEMNRHGHGRIVNVSSGMGALTGMGGGAAAYRVSKAALNAMTLVAARAAQGDVKVNAVCPGWVRTDMGGRAAPLSVEEGAAGIVWAATLPADGPNGGFFRHGKRIDW